MTEDQRSTGVDLDSPRTRRRSEARSWSLAVLRVLLLPLWAGLVAAWAWPLYAVGFVLGGGRPPVVPSAARFRDVLRRVLGPVPAPGLALVDRVTVLVSLVERLLLVPLFGLAWWLDELLYGRALAAVRVHEPLFELSAARSGSTQLAHYLEDDPGLIAPSTLRAFAPYLWLWRISERSLGRWLAREAVQAMVKAPMSQSHLERHEVDAFRTDSIDPLFYAFHLGDLLNTLGPDAMEGLDPSALTAANRTFWEHDFLRYLDGLMRKVLLAYGEGGRRAFVKGHNLAAADAMAARWPDAVFLTVVRDPVKRIQSVVNFHREQPGEVVAALPWAWLVARDVSLELRYNDEELVWYTRPDGPRRVVVRFDDYVHDLPGVLTRVYRECLGREVPPTLPTTHTKRKRSYTTDRSLEELGVDVAALRERSTAFAGWCKGGGG